MADTDTPLRIPPTIPPDAEQRLATGTISVVGRMPNASNGTFLVQLDDPDASGTHDASADDSTAPYGLAIYKPGRGERPLWDFPPGLFRREVAAYRLSRATGLDVIPPTVLRTDAPFGEGSLQWFVNADFREHYFTLCEQRPDLHDQLRALAVFDVLANNTDRKSGHCLLEPDAGRVWGIDNGLCFSTEARLRTVIWDFAGEALPEPWRDVAWAIADTVPDTVVELLDDDEVEAIRTRAVRLARRSTLPVDRSGRAYPWPLV
jgi:uncharacterized repeat protein (TIGR03843 family)